MARMVEFDTYDLVQESKAGKRIINIDKVIEIASCGNKDFTSLILTNGHEIIVHQTVHSVKDLINQE